MHPARVDESAQVHDDGPDTRQDGDAGEWWTTAPIAGGDRLIPQLLPL